MQNNKPIRRSRAWRRGLALAMVPTAIALSWWAVGATGAAAYKQVQLATEPLSTSGASAKPTLTLALSVEFPTVGAQYRTATYSNADKYIGYFDSESCYAYDTDRFVRSAAATDRRCKDAFSGNFMNWASSSAIDLLRLGLTGGDRIVDSPTETVLQRAYLPAGGPSGNFWNNGSYFPSKAIDQVQAAGALPIANRRADGPTYIASCKDRIYLGTGQNFAGDACANPNVAGSVDKPGANGDRGVFLARVKVCDSLNGELTDPRRGLCLKYPIGTFKPVGNLQKYSDNVRVAAFGYLMVDGDSRYGGVLRASMKYVGSKTFDANGSLVAGLNPKREWDDQTGVFYVNPEGAAEGNSGVVNYLNKFGRVGVLGRYKTNDPVSELYYESLRYVQGLQPTPQAVSGSITDEMKAGFPFASTWEDPHAGGSSTADYSCVNNNIATIGDIFVHADKSIPGNTRTTFEDTARPANLSANEPDFRYWTQVVGGFESNHAVTYRHSDGANYQTSNPNAPLPGADRWGMENQDTGAGGKAAYYMAGMAYWAHTHDIRGADWSATDKRRLGMRATTYMLDVNENSASSQASTRQNSQYFLAAKYGGFTDASKRGNPFLDKDGKPSNAGWEKPGDPGEARTYFLSSSAQAVLDGLDAIFAGVATEANNIAGGDVSSQSPAPQGDFLYNASFDRSDWSGELRARPLTVSANTGVAIDDSDTAGWRAGRKLDATSHKDRNIVAGEPRGNSGGAVAAPFQWAGLSDEFRKNLLAGALGLGGSALDSIAGNATAIALGQAQVDYLRGDKTNEGKTLTVVPGTSTTSTPFTFRARTHLLGDIVNSAAAYSGAPTRAISAPGYAAFYNANKDRTPAVFVGANDGMLHAFAATSGADGGKELFAYIPSWLADDLPSLARSDYGKTSANPHRAFVDGSPTVGEAQLNPDDPASWRTVLVAGTGAGGQGVFALDVTRPASFGAGNVLWEFSDKDDPDMGNVVGKLQLLKFRTKAASSTAPAVYKWFAAVASGVNNNAADNNASTSGQPALFLLALDKPAGQKWVAGSNYFKLSTPVDPALSATVAPGLINFTPDGGNAGEVARIYMGDLHGRLWKLDFTAYDSTDWEFSKLVPYNSGTTTPRPLFIARDGSAAQAVQPITMPPTLITGPRKSTIVIFGTGKYLEPADNLLSASTQIQSVYAVMDDNSSTSSATSGASLAGRSALVQGTASDSGVTTPAFAWGRPTTSNGLKAGWYFDFGSAAIVGERQINLMDTQGSKVNFGSLMPPGGVNQPCAPAGGRTYTIDFATGNGESRVSTVGLLSAPIVLSLADATTRTVSNNTGRNLVTTKTQTIWIGDKGIAVSTAVGDGGTASRRLSWRLIENYQDLKN